MAEVLYTTDTTKGGFHVIEFWSRTPVPNSHCINSYFRARRFADAMNAVCDGETMLADDVTKQIMHDVTVEMSKERMAREGW